MINHLYDNFAEPIFDKGAALLQWVFVWDFVVHDAS